MEPISTFSGIASGIQWRDLVDQIIQVESAPIDRLESRISDIRTRSSAWTAIRARLDNLDAAAQELSSADAFRRFATSLSRVSGSEPFGASAGTEASPGNYQVAVHRLATREKLGSAAFDSSTEALGLSGEFVVNGSRVAVEATDTLADVADAVSQTFADSGVQASVVSTSTGGARMTLTAADTGENGIQLVDGSSQLLRSLGFLDGTTTLKSATSDGALGDAFASASATVGSLLALEAAPAAGDVTVAGETVTLDLSGMGLDGVAQAINDAATLAGKSFSAEVVSETDASGDTVYRLDISGTTAFGDGNGILEALGVVEGGRGAVAQEVTSGTAFTDASSGLAATAASALADLQIDGAGAGVTTGDTLTLQGTRGDGTTFTATYTVGGSDTLADLTAFLTAGDDDFGSGRTASVSISASGELVVTDDTEGGSQLSLSVVANNEGGGTLDFGDFSVSDEGRQREITTGRDALVEVDGTFLASASNQVSEAIAGVTLELTDASGEVVELSVDREVDGTVSAIKGFVDAYNSVQSWISNQFGGAGAEEGVSAPALSGDSTLRGIRNSLRTTMNSTLLAGVSGGAQRLAEVGIEIDRYGSFQLDSAALTEALETDPTSVERLFTSLGRSDTVGLEYVTSTDATEEGLHAVDVTTLAETASVTGSGFGSGLGTYQDDGTADTLLVQDLDTGSTYRVELNDGDDADTVVQALNTAFGSVTTRRLESSASLYSDAVGTAATASTALADLHDSGGTGMAVAAGDTLTFSGTGSDGGAVLLDFEISDPATETVQDILTRVETALGGDVTASLEAGQLVVTGNTPGRSSMTLAVSSDNAGGGTFSLGTVDVAEEGHGTARMVAANVGGEIQITHQDYGTKEGFELSFEAGGADGTASLGLAAGSHTGVDMAGTIGGYAATGAGRTLVGDEGHPTEGLMISYTGADTGEVGTATFSRGIAARMELALSPLLGTGAGSIDDLNSELDEQVADLQDRITDLEDRLELRREGLIRRFIAMEEAMAQAQSQTEWLTAQLSRLDRQKAAN